MGLIFQDQNFPVLNLRSFIPFRSGVPRISIGGAYESRRET